GCIIYINYLYSRRRHTISKRDWSSDVCSSDLKEKVKEETDFYFPFDIQPYYYQKEMLENLQVEREVFGRHKNLLVAATGVGKTVISAFDYKRFLKQYGRPAKLLFVAHREEILK